MDTKELRNLSRDELIQKQKALKEELFKLNRQRYTGNVAKPHEFSLVRKEIARILTLLSKERQK